MCSVAWSCPPLCSPMDCNPPGSSVHGILQAKILEWVAIPFSKGTSWPRDQTWVSCTAGRFFIVWVTSEPWKIFMLSLKVSEHRGHGVPSFVGYKNFWHLGFTYPRPPVIGSGFPQLTELTMKPSYNCLSVEFRLCRGERKLESFSHREIDRKEHSIQW